MDRTIFKTAAIAGAASGIGRAARTNLLDAGWTALGLPVDGGMRAAFIPPGSNR
jgi:NAD(P)-dependent dehydrogenase (short-subunit alcohol dehydrogenase family)